MTELSSQPEDPPPIPVLSPAIEARILDFHANNNGGGHIGELLVDDERDPFVWLVREKVKRPTIKEEEFGIGSRSNAALKDLMWTSYRKITGTKPSPGQPAKMRDSEQLEPRLFDILLHEDKMTYNRYIAYLTHAVAPRVNDLDTGEILLDIAEHMHHLATRAEGIGEATMKAMVNTQPIPVLVAPPPPAPVPMPRAERSRHGVAVFSPEAAAVSSPQERARAFVEQVRAEALAARQNSPESVDAL